MDGTVGVLNVGAGDTKLSFDPNNPQERIRAARIVTDMIRRGYALLVETEVNGEKRFTRAMQFDEAHCEYIIADFDPVTAAAVDGANHGQPKEEPQQSEDESSAPPAGAQARKRPGQKPRTKRVKAESTRSVAVPPVAGG